MKRKLLMLFWGSFLLASQVVAQQKPVTGKVTSADDNQPIPGVSVTIKGATAGTQTNPEGIYTIQASAGDVLVFSYISMLQQEIVVGANATINVSLRPNSQDLQEVVVVGYGTQRKADLTGAVATIDTKVLDSRPVTDVARALQGTTPGLSITTSSGEIGQSPNIRLRGNTGSLTGTGGGQPLILVDNVEIPDLQLVNPEDIESISVLKDAASSSIYGTRAAWGVILITTKTGKKNSPARISYSNNIGFSTPTTMPEIAPAADGAEMAFLARRRANPDEALFFPLAGLNFDDIAIQKMREWEQLYGGQDLGSEMVLGRDYEIRDEKLFFYRPWDVGEMYMRDWTPQQKHDISITGGSEKTTYNIGLGYLGQEGILKVNPDKFNRYNLNLGVNTEVNKWFDARAKVLYSNTLLTEPFQYAAAVYDPWYYLYRWPTVFPYGTVDGKPFRNAITDVSQAKMNESTNGLTRISVGGTIKAMEGLTIDADYTYSGTNDHDHLMGGVLSGLDFWNGLDAVTKQIPYRAYSAANFNTARYNSTWSSLNTGKAFATYIKNINDHAFKVIAGGDIETFEDNYQYSERRDLIDLQLGEVNLATGDQFAGSSHGRWNTVGVFGRVNYSYKNKYLLEVNGRYDGSSRLSPNRKWGFFPSMSAGYILTEESFMDFSKPVLSFLKIRGSYGEIGNQNTSVGSIYSVLPTKTSDWLLGGKNTPTVTPPSPISSLTWETVSTLDFGADARFIDNKLGVTFDWYKRTTSDMHTPGMTLPSSYGANPPKRNFGTLETTGWELAVDFNHSFQNGLNLNATAMLSDFQEILTEYEGANLFLTGNSFTDRNNYQGKNMGEIWGYETDRFFTNDDFQQDPNGNLIQVGGKYVLKEGIPNQTQFEEGGFFFGPGDVKYKDLNGDGVITRGSNSKNDPGDQTVIGNSTPRYQYGFRLGADWKGFDLNVFFQGVGQRDYWAQGPMFVPGWRTTEAWYANQLDYWTESNPDAFYPRPSDQLEKSTKNFYPQTKYLLDLSYLRLKNVAIGYSLPKTLVEKVRFSRLRVYASAENLFEMDKLKDIPIDPEVNVTTDGANDPAAFGRVYPYRRTISFGIQATF